jgi:hypothetical protein
MIDDDQMEVRGFFLKKEREALLLCFVVDTSQIDPFFKFFHLAYFFS